MCNSKGWNKTGGVGQDGAVVKEVGNGGMLEIRKRSRNGDNRSVAMIESKEGCASRRMKIWSKN